MPRTTKTKQAAKKDAGDSTKKSGAVQDDGAGSSTLTEAELIKRLEAGTGAVATPMVPVDEHPAIPATLAKIMKDKIGPDVEVELLPDDLDGQEDTPAKKDTALSAFGGQAQVVIKDMPPLGKVSKPMPVSDFLKTVKDDSVPTVAVGPTKNTLVKEKLPFEPTPALLPEDGDDPRDPGDEIDDAQLPKREPFDDITDPDILFLINEWGATEKNRIIIRTHVESFTVRNVIKRADYNDQIEYEMVFAPVNLPCNFIVDHVPEKIAETNSDIKLVSEVVRRATREMDLTIMAVIKERLDDKQRETRAKATRVTKTGVRLGQGTEVEL